MGIVKALSGFFDLSRPKSRMQNGNHFAKFWIVFSSILQNGGPKPKNFWLKWGTKQALDLQKRIEEM